MPFNSAAQRKAVMAMLKDTRITDNQKRIIASGYTDLKKKHEHYMRQLQIGIMVEHEHTNNREVATQIARDHLAEDKNYYTKLKRCKL